MSNTMRAAVLYGTHDIRVETMDVRPPGDGEAVVKVAYCGVCGTDLHIFHGDEGSAEVTPPIVLGHEMSGIVMETGKGVNTLRPGDHVVVDPNFYCGECYDCRTGQEHFCSGMKAVGVTQHGGFAEYCTLPAKTAHPVPKEMPLDVAAFAEPLACCLHGMDLTRVQLGNQVLLIGAGTIGLIMLQLSKLAGASRLTVIEPDVSKRVLAESLGADMTFACGADYMEYASQTSGVRADRVIECAGRTETVSLAIRAASKGATVMIFGLTPPQATVDIQPFEIFKKELHITSSFVNPYTESRAVELLSAGKVRVAELIAERVPLERLAEVLAEPAYRSKTKILVGGMDSLGSSGSC